MSELSEKLGRGETLTAEEQARITADELKEGNDKLLASIEGRREELRKLDAKKTAEEQKTVTEFSKKTLEEYTRKAENQVFAQLTADGIELTEEKKAAIRAKRERLDEGHVTYDAIVDDFLSAAAAVDKDVLFGAKRKNAELEKNAAQFTSQNAGANGSGAGGGEGSAKFSQQVWDWVNESKRQGITISPEEAQKILESREGQSGLRRVYK